MTKIDKGIGIILLIVCISVQIVIFYTFENFWKGFAIILILAILDILGLYLLKEDWFNEKIIELFKKDKLALILGLCATLLFIGYLFIIQYLRDNYLSWRLWAVYITLIVIIQSSIWRRLAQWARLNRDRIYYRTFEYLFFIFIFVSTYFLGFLLDKNFPLGVSSVLFIFSVLSSAYCGELFFLEGISDIQRTENNRYEARCYRNTNEKIFILGFYIIFIPIIYIFSYLFGINSHFLKLFSLPILIFMGFYIIILVLTSGNYYNSLKANINRDSGIYIFVVIVIFMGIVFFSTDEQINNFIESFGQLISGL